MGFSEGHGICASTMARLKRKQVSPGAGYGPMGWGGAGHGGARARIMPEVISYIPLSSDTDDDTKASGAPRRARTIWFVEPSDIGRSTRPMMRIPFLD